MTKQYDNFADLITFTRASTGTYLDSDGLLKTATTNTPRIEFDINGNRKGILIEEARTNLIQRSEEFDNAGWGKIRATISADISTAPSGASTADKLIENTDNNTHFTEVAATFTAAQHSFSVFLKAGERSWARLVAVDGAAYFDLSAGAVGSVSAGSVSLTAQTPVAAGNGWFRCSVTFTPVAGSNVAQIRLATDNNVQSYLGDGTSGIFVWGAQLEAGSFPTSYIPTAGSTATRAADVASIPTSAFGYNADKGTVVCEFETQFGTPTGFPRIWEIGNTSTGINGVNVYVGSGGSNTRIFAISNTVLAVEATVRNAPSPVSGNLAFAFADNDFAGVIDGESPVTDTSGSFTTPSIPRDTLKLGGSGNATILNMSGHIKSIQYYPRRLTNSQLQRLTS